MTQRGESRPAAAAFDELLVTLVQAGDRRAAQQLARRWHPRLMRTARRTVGTDLAAGVVQDCWVSILRGIPSLRDPARFPAWTFGILHRRAADAMRRIGGTRRERVELPPNLAARTSPPGEALALAQVMDSLPPDQRLAAHLFFVEGLSLAEIAEVQAVPEGTAKSRLFHARRKLKAALTGDD